MYLWKPSTETQKVFGAEETDPGWKTSAALRSATAGKFCVEELRMSHTGNAESLGTTCKPINVSPPALTTVFIAFDVPGATQMMCKTWPGHLTHPHSYLAPLKTFASSGM